ncbi:MAG TPA: hypothetical protein VFY16_01005 [Gemmatimonadaceae bacterium]|nr:hypothetical protein [Gemmatimonadaceae bacterium]
MSEPTVGELAQLYLGNILYALERTALSLEAEARHEDAAFYRGIARALAEAHGRALTAQTDSDSAPPAR